jgi:hypothetical protein
MKNDNSYQLSQHFEWDEAHEAQKNASAWNPMITIDTNWAHLGMGRMCPICIIGFQIWKHDR